MLLAQGAESIIAFEEFNFDRIINRFKYFKMNYNQKQNLKINDKILANIDGINRKIIITGFKKRKDKSLKYYKIEKILEKNIIEDEPTFSSPSRFELENAIKKKDFHT